MKKNIHRDSVAEDGVVNAIGRRDRTTRDEKTPPSVGRADAVRGEGAAGDLQDASVDYHVAADAHVVGKRGRDNAGAIVVVGLRREVAIDRQCRAREGTAGVGIGQAKGHVTSCDRFGKIDRAGVGGKNRVVRRGVAPSRT